MAVAQELATTIMTECGWRAVMKIIAFLISSTIGMVEALSVPSGTDGRNPEG